ncbi:MAG TPA: hypothetical protein VFS00_18275, partial [Polyangiaceae bacterium]|nr:hypothetical protein [Polyangiaceae bacterium]
QVKGQGAVDHRADLWALGCIVYECLTGRTVWSTEQGVAMTFAQIASAPLPKLGRYRPDLPPALDDWFRRALERDILERFQSSKELTDALADALEQSPPSLLAAPSSLDVIEAREAPGDSPGFDYEHVRERLEAGAAAPASARASAPNPPTPAPAAAAPAEAGAQRMPAASLVDTGTSSSVKEEPFDLPEPYSKRRRGSGWALFTVVAIAAGFGGWEVYRTRNLPDVSGGKPPAAASVASASSSGPSFDSNRPLPSLPTSVPRWVSLVQGGQEQVSKGDLDGALKTFREAAEANPGAQTRAIVDHANAALANKGPCRLSGLGRLRPYNMTTGTVGRAQLVKTNRALLALWSDDHEGPKHDHAYAIALDYALRPIGAPIDLTPEAEDVGVVSARAVGERVAVLYTDTRGSRAGLYLRWLDGDGRIDAPAKQVANARAAASQPSLTGEGPELLWAVWEEERDGDSLDLMTRRFDTHGPAAPEVRLTDFLGRLSGARTRAAMPSVSMTAGTLQLLFRLERDTTRTVQHMAMLDAERTLGTGVVSPPHGARADRTASPLHAMTLDRSEKSDTPQIACDALGCFAAWHVERPGGGGAYAAFLDPKTGQV